MAKSEKNELIRSMLQQVASQVPLQKVKEQLESVRKSDTSTSELESVRTAGVARGSEAFDILRSDQLEGAAVEAIDSLVRSGFDAPINENQQMALEAIVLPRLRPVVNIVSDTFATPPDPWTHLSQGLAKQRIDGVMRSIGRIEVPRHPRLIPYAGTGFIVGKVQNPADSSPRHLMMTNRHVAELFARGLGVNNLSLHPGQTVLVDLKREIVPSTPQLLSVEAVVMIHPYWDMALLRIIGLDEKHPILSLSTEDPGDMADRDVVVIGYPAQDWRNDLDLQNRIFGGIYEVKRMQPGKLKIRQNFESYGQSVNAVTHDSSTLGGNSGSAVIEFQDPDTTKPARVVGLHFAGEYLKANYAVPTFDLAQDSKVVDAGVHFVGRVEPRGDFYGPIWNRAENIERAAIPSPATAVAGFSNNPSPNIGITTAPGFGQPSDNQGKAIYGAATYGTATWNIPMQISVTIGSPSLVTNLTNAVSIQTVAPAEGLFGRTEPSAVSDDRFSSESLEADPLNWKAMLSLALASRLAYRNASEINHITSNIWGMSSCKFIEADDTQCFVAAMENMVLVAFRGTESLRDWLADLNIFSTDRPYGIIHRGFSQAFSVVDAQLREELQKFPTKKIVMTGHSLGGALATIAAAEWNVDFKVSSVYTFGQPAVGRGEFPGFIAQHYGDKFIRVVNDDDIVPRVPPNFRHVGRLIHFDATGNVSGVETAMNALTSDLGESVPGVPMMSEIEFDQMRARLLLERAQIHSGDVSESTVQLQQEGILPSVSDHSMDRYLEKIAKKI